MDAADGRFAEPFMTAPSPGIIAARCRTRGYDTEDAYLAALGKALQIEYETIVRHGYLLQIDAPDLALERHISYQDRPLADFLDFAERVVATINTALVNIPRDRVRMHVCWGNYEGPHDCDVSLHEILPAIQQTKVGGFVLPLRQSAACARAPLPRRPETRRRPGDHRRRDRSLTNFVEHPEVVAERSSAWRNRSAIRRGCWPARIAASTPPPAAAAWRMMWCGRS